MVAVEASGVHYDYDYYYMFILYIRIPTQTDDHTRE